ncbi:MAG TPA: sigma-70 family RNA polymerase sigma factor [Solirubrobacteraceae bacterium]|nr:sigma-70 family RNA polymerase sigma factor [Solirubrobacteraceae bacterium]
MALFRAGHDDAFRVIHDRYRQRLFAYTRQMLAHRQDAEDALQDIFVRAYAGLRASDRELALRAWLYRVAHNRCIDQLRRPAPPPPEVLELLRSPAHDPIAEADRRESLRRLIADVRRLPDQQRSALLMRELGGMSYTDMSAALGVTIPAVKSLLVRARLGLAQAIEARDTACSEIREELILSHDRGLRPNATARRHMRDCAGCREFRQDLRGVSRRFAAIVPTLGPLGVLANVLGIGGAGSGAAGGALAAGGAAGGGTAIVSVGTMSAGAAHVATLLAAAVVTAGGAVELQHTLPAPAHHVHHARVASRQRSHPSFTPSAPAAIPSQSSEAPAVSSSVVSQAAHSLMASDPGGSTQTPSSASTSAITRTKPATTTTTTVTVSVTSAATGGISTTLGRGGAAPSDPADTSTTAAGGTLATSTTSTTSANGTQSSTGTDSTQSGSASGDSTSSTQSGSSGSTGSSSSDGSTGGSQSTSSTGTGSSTGTATGGTPSPSQ